MKKKNNNYFIIMISMLTGFMIALLFLYGLSFIMPEKVCSLECNSGGTTLESKLGAVIINNTAIYKFYEGNYVHAMDWLDNSYCNIKYVWEKEK